MNEEQKRISGLIIKAKQGDESAFEELYKITSPKAYFVALKICSNEHDAEDILQESYIKVLDKIDTVDPDGNFTAWVYQIVANTAKNFIKAQKPLLFSDNEEEIIGNLPDENTDFSPEEHVDRDELCNEVMAAVDELTAEKRACVMMMYFGDMSVNEIAQSIEVPVSTVKNRLFTARKDLKTKFEKKGITAIYSAAPIGLLIWALSKTGNTTAAAFAASAASGTVLTGVSTAAVSSSVSAGATATGVSAAATTTTTAVSTGTGVAAKIAALSVAQKVVAGVAATAVIGGSTAGVVTVVKNSEPEETTAYLVEEVTTAPDYLSEYVFEEISTHSETSTETLSQTNRESTKATTKRTSTSEYTTAPSSTTTKKETTTINNTTTTKSTTKKVTTTKTTTSTTSTTKETTTQKETTTKPTTTRNSSARPTTTRSSTTTTKTETTTKPATTQPTTAQPTTTQATTTQPTTTEPTTKAKATVNVEVVDMDEQVVATFSFTVDADTEMTWEYLVTQIKNKGYEPMAGIYGDAVGAVAQAGRNYSITAEL